MSLVPTRNGKYDMLSDDEIDSEALVSTPIRSASMIGGRGRPYKAAMIFGVVAVVAIIAYASKPAVPASHKGVVLGFDTNGIIQESSSAAHTCPSGYAPSHLDMMNHDADMHEETLSLDKCAEKCDEDDKCKGFEFNEAANHCWITRNGHHCTDKQHYGWVSCVKSKHTCPSGYSVTDLDIMNHDADMHMETLSAEECAEKCDKDDKCKGFEFNEVADHCWITRTGHHCTDEQHDGWVSCIQADKVTIPNVTTTIPTGTTTIPSGNTTNSSGNATIPSGNATNSSGNTTNSSGSTDLE